MLGRGLIGVLFHALRHDSMAGWSKVQSTSLDVAKIIKVDYHPRMFRLWNRNHPYTLRITYAEPHENVGVAPVISNHGGVAIYNDVELTSLITRRYKTEQHCQEEISEILRKQGLLDTYTQRLRDKIMKQQ